MEPVTVGFLSIIMLLVLLMLGLHIAVAMGVVGLVGYTVLVGWQPALNLAAGTAFSVCSRYEFSVVPLFMLMGLVAYTSGLTNYLYDAMHRWFGKLPGGLMIATTLAAGVFAAVSGSSIAAAVTFTKVGVPHMMKYKYHGGLACAAVAAVGTQSAMIPPSGLLVLYAIITDQSIGKCLMAGLLPGILSNLLYVLLVYLLAVWKPHLLPRGPSCSWKEKFVSLKMVWPMPIVTVAVLGGLYVGLFSPTEAAGVGAFAAIVVAMVAVGFKRVRLWEAFTSTLSASIMIFTIFIGAFIFGSFLAVSRLPIDLATMVQESGMDRFSVLLMVIIMYFIMGMFMSSTAMVVITLPIIFPIIVSLGYDPIWFAIIVVKMVEIGVITPPVGMNVFAVKGAIGDAVPLGDIFKWVSPFLVVDIITLSILIAFPSISLFLPHAMK